MAASPTRPEDIDAHLAQSYRDLEGALGEARVLANTAVIVGEAVLEGAGRMPIVPGHMVMSKDEAEALLSLIYLLRAEVTKGWDQYHEGFPSVPAREAAAASRGIAA